MGYGCLISDTGNASSRISGFGITKGWLFWWVNLLCSIWSSFQLTLLVMKKMKNVHPTMWDNVKSVWCCMMGRRGWQAERFQVPHVGGEDPASPQEAGESSGQPQPWPAGLYPALPTVSALPGHSRTHQICLISGCGKIVYCKAGDVAELANHPPLNVFTNTRLTWGIDHWRISGTFQSYMVNQSVPRLLYLQAFFV